jgi:hypothetical protein
MTPCQRSMPGYIDKALKKYQQCTPTAPRDAPYATAPIQYGAKVQCVQIDTTSPLSPAELKKVQDIVGILLYNARTVNPTLLAALSSIAAQEIQLQTSHGRCMSPTTQLRCNQSQRRLTYHACDMILAVHTDTFYLSKAGGKKPCSGTLLPHQSEQEKFQERSCADTVSHHQACDVIHVQSGTPSTVLRLQDGCNPTHHSQGIGAQSSQSNPNYHQQHHRARPHHGYHDSQSLKIHGSMFSLAEIL